VLAVIDAMQLNAPSVCKSFFDAIILVNRETYSQCYYRLVCNIRNSMALY